MRITGDGIWGQPRDRDEAKATLRRAVELGVNFIDTADSYGPDVSETLIAEALHPYPDDLVIATKGGLERTGPGRWPANGRPEHLRARLRGQPAAAAPRPDPAVPVPSARPRRAARGLDRRARRAQGRRQGPPHRRVQRHRGPAPRARSRSRRSCRCRTATTSTDRASESLLDLCEQERLAFLPWAPILDLDGVPVVARSPTVTVRPPAQVVLAWLLARSPAMLPIPGTSSVGHLESNVAAASVELAPEEVAAITEQQPAT